MLWFMTADDSDLASFCSSCFCSTDLYFENCLEMVKGKNSIFWIALYISQNDPQIIIHVSDTDVLTFWNQIVKES